MSIKNSSEILINYCQRLYEKNMIAGLDGNFSVKLDNNSILITPAGLAKGSLNSDDLIIIDFSGNKISGRGKPSSETAMHLQIYQNRPEINACCHAHPVHVTAFVSSGKQLPKNILPEIILSIGDIELVEYIPTGLAEEWARLVPHIKKNNAFLLANHGVLTVGENIEEAYYRMETIEHFAKIAFLGEALGGLKALDSDEVTRLKQVRSNKQKKS